MRHIEAQCVAARAAARAAANAADAAAIEVNAELKRIAFFARQAQAREAAAERARAARALLATRKHEAAGPSEEERIAAVRALEMQRSKAQARSEELAAKQAVALERGRARKTARVLKQVLAKAVLVARNGAEAAERYASEARFAAESEQRSIAAAAAAAAAEAESVAAAIVARAEEKKRRHIRRKLETVKRELRGVSAAAKRCAAAAATAAASTASGADTVVQEALRFEAARHVRVAAVEDGVAEECQICFMELPLLTMECGHELCPPCLQKWTAMTIKSNRSKTSCPFCRVAITKKPPGLGRQTSAWQPMPRSAAGATLTVAPTDYVIPQEVRNAGAVIARDYHAARDAGQEPEQPSIAAASAPTFAPPGIATEPPPGLAAAADFAPSGSAFLAPSGSAFLATSGEAVQPATHSFDPAASSFYTPPTRILERLPREPHVNVATARVSDGGSQSPSLDAAHLSAGAPNFVPPGFLQPATFFGDAATGCAFACNLFVRHLCRVRPSPCYGTPA